MHLRLASLLFFHFIILVHKWGTPCELVPCLFNHCGKFLSFFKYSFLKNLTYLPAGPEINSATLKWKIIESVANLLIEIKMNPGLTSFMFLLPTVFT